MKFGKKRNAVSAFSYVPPESPQFSGHIGGIGSSVRADARPVFVSATAGRFPSVPVDQAVADRIADVFSAALKSKRAVPESDETWLLNRLVGACNELIVQENRENSLYSQLVQVVAGHDGFRSSVIGILAEGEKNSMRFAASDPTDLAKCAGKFSVGEASNHFASSIAKAISSGQTVIVKDQDGTRRNHLGTGDEVKPGCKSCIVAPIVCSDESLGVLAIFAEDIDAFTDQVRVTVEKIASNVALGVERLRNANAKRRAESDLQVLSAHRQSMLANSIVGITLLHDRKFVWVNERFSEMFGGTEADFTGKPTLIVYPAVEQFESFGKRAYSVLAKGKVYSADLHLRRLDGTPIWCRLSGHATTDMRDGESLWMIEDITDRKLAEKAAKNNERRTRQALMGTIRCLTRTIAVRDSYTAGHQERVAELAVAIAERMGLSNERTLGIEMGALIHDIGKIHIPGEILTRPGRLSDAEFEFIKSHPEVGYQIISDVEMDWPVREIILQHHEHLDGSGYPNGLSGDQIILESRIVAVADTIEAVTSHRPYRPALSLETGLKIIEDHRGEWFDPDVVDICIDLIRSGKFAFERPQDQIAR